ncbi:MAG: hypothetical protein FJ405_05780 [Verrucomicrobia bacterium]|nr:hypothetical protein [Verrucomicrobiota bacterium]
MNFRAVQRLQRFPSWALALRLAWLIVLPAIGCLFGGCASRFPKDAAGQVLPASGERVDRLARDIAALDPAFDAAEAQAVARASMDASRQLANDYRMVRPAFVHSILVNTRLRRRGLCYHWADDLTERLGEWKHQTLRLYRVVSGMNTPREHNALVVAPVLRPMRAGLVLDGWRTGGELHWIRVGEDRKYRWVLRQDLQWLREQIEPKSGIDPSEVSH